MREGLNLVHPQSKEVALRDHEGWTLLEVGPRGRSHGRDDFPGLS